MDIKLFNIVKNSLRNYAFMQGTANIVVPLTPDYRFNIKFNTITNTIEVIDLITRVELYPTVYEERSVYCESCDGFDSFTKDEIYAMNVLCVNVVYGLSFSSKVEFDSL